MRAWGDRRPYVRQTRNNGVATFEARSSLPEPPNTAMSDTLVREGQLLVSLSSDESVANEETAVAEVVESGAEGTDANAETAVAEDEEHGVGESGAAGTDADAETRIAAQP